VIDKDMRVLQNSVDLKKPVPVQCNETYSPAPHVQNQAMNMKVEEVSCIDVKEERPVPMTFVGIKAEHEVSCMSVCPLLGTTEFVIFSKWLVAAQNSVLRSSTEHSFTDEVWDEEIFGTCSMYVRVGNCM
jgi:hypothetical protein